MGERRKERGSKGKEGRRKGRKEGWEGRRERGRKEKRKFLIELKGASYRFLDS